jgi:probable phosphoglycerate mutase
MRHADVSYFGDAGPVSPAGVRLTDPGVEQARAAGRAMRAERFDRVVTSALPRTEQTARLVLEELAHPPPGPFGEEPDLRELHAGALNEISDNDLEREFLSAFHAEAPREATVLGGESIGSLLDRVLPAFERVCEEDWKTLLLVLHGGVNRAILSRAIAGEPRFFGHIEQSAACINILDEGPGWLVRAINVTPYDTAHLSGRSTTMEETLGQYRAYRGTP